MKVHFTNENLSKSASRVVHTTVSGWHVQLCLVGNSVYARTPDTILGHREREKVYKEALRLFAKDVSAPIV